MNKRESKKFEKLLVEERRRLSQSIGSIEQDTLYESAQDSSGDLSAFAESGTDNFDRETALHIASDESQRLVEINDALQRIEDSAYGVCEGCDSEIPKKRLEVFPSARYCIECQSKIEKNGSL